VLTQVSLNNPYARSLFEACRACGVTSINLIQKPIASLSIPFTAGVWHASRGLPDHIITATHRNRSILEAHVSHQSALHIGYIDPLKDSCRDVAPGPIEKVILILGVDSKTNELLVRLSWDHLKIPPENICLRPHPLLEVSEQSNLADFMSTTGISVERAKWEATIIPGATLCISVCSSALAEAASFGAYCMWAPFMEDASCVMYFLIDELGFVAEDESDFCEAISRYFSDDEFRLLMWEKQAKVLQSFRPQGDAYNSFSHILGEGI
jgi:hypothetical protein